MLLFFFKCTRLVFIRYFIWIWTMYVLSTIKRKKKGIKLKKKISAFDDEAKICKKKQKFLFRYEQLNIKVRSALSLIFLYCIDGRSCCESSSLSHQLWLYYYYYNQTRNCLNSVDKFINAGRIGNSLTFWQILKNLQYLFLFSLVDESVIMTEKNVWDSHVGHSQNNGNL